MKDEPELSSCIHGNLGLLLFKEGKPFWIQKPHCPICNPEEDEDDDDDLMDESLP